MSQPLFTVHPKLEEKEVPVKTNISAEELKNYDDVGFMNAMVLVLLGNYSQTGHFGGPLSYTPANVVAHLAGPELGGLRYDIRNPKHPFTDKFMLTGGHCIPTCYALWMILYESMAREYAETKDDKFKVDPNVAMLSIDALGFRRSHGALEDLLKKNGLEEDPLFAQAKLRGIRALMGHSETTDVTNDVNGGPSGIGVSTTAGKALFWDFFGAPESMKIVAFEGEFAFTEGHSQELKTMALAQQVGKRLRLFFSYNNAGIDDVLIGGDLNGVIKDTYKDYDVANQFASYGWNVFVVRNGGDYNEIMACWKAMEEWPVEDRRPMVVIAHTIKGWWPSGKPNSTAPGKWLIGEKDQTVSYQSHPYAFGMNGDYFQLLAGTFESRFGVTFEGIREGAKSITNEKDRLVQFKRNMDIAFSVLDKDNGKLRKWVTSRLLAIADTLDAKDWASHMSRIKIQNPVVNPFRDERLRVDKLPVDVVEFSTVHPTTGKEVKSRVELFSKPGPKKGARRGISEVGKWINYVTGNKYITVAADLSNSINVEGCTLTGHYDPVLNPNGTRLKAGITECVNAATACGLASQTLSETPDEHLGLWGVSGTYGAFTPLMYLPVRIFSQQNQDSPFELGVCTIVAGHSGPETAADARSHFGIFAPQVWTLFPEGHVINLYLWDYNDVAAAYFAAVQAALTIKKSKVIVVHVARPDSEVADRSKFADTDIKAAAKGCYVIREYEAGKPKMGTVLVQGSSSTVNVVKLLDRFNADGINVRIISVISEELLRLQSEEYQNFILPLDQKFDCMVLTTMTKRIMPLSGLGPLTKEYTMSSDFDDRWRTGGLEDDVIREAKLDTESIYAGISKFAHDRESRLTRQREAFAGLV